MKTVPCMVLAGICSLASSTALAQLVGINGAACAFASIGDAALGVVNGDIIYASPGTYAEDTIVLSGISIAIVSSDANCGAITSQMVTIEPTGTDRIFELDAAGLWLIGVEVQLGDTADHGSIVYADNNSGLLLSDSTIRDGHSSINGGCIYALDSSIILIDGSTIEGCTADQFGGGAYLGVGSSITVEAGSAIRNNTAVNGAGGGIDLVGATADISGEISGNSAISGGGIGAISSGAVPADVELKGSALLANNSAEFGGGASVAGSNSVLRLLDDTLVDNNVATAHGGGAALYAASLEIEDRVTIEDNQAGTDGGGVYADQTVVTITGESLGAIKIRHNTADLDGGGLYMSQERPLTASFVNFSDNVAAGAGGGLFLDGTTGSLINARLLNNVAGSAGGGGVYMVGSGTTLAIRSDFVACNPAQLASQRFCSELRFNDTTGTGGGMKVVTGAVADIDTTSFVGNHSPLNGEAVMVYGGNAQATLRNALVVDHLGGVGMAVAITNGVGNIYSSTFSNNFIPVDYLTNGTGVFHRNIVWGNTNDSILTTTSGNCNTTQTLVGSPVGNNNNQLNPLFDAGNARSPFKLLAASPAIDACGNGPAIDLDNVARPVNGAFDKGAFEMP